MSYICQEIGNERARIREERKIEDIRRYRRKVQAEIRRNKKQQVAMMSEQDIRNESISFDIVEVVAFLIFTITMIIKTVEVIV